MARHPFSLAPEPNLASEPKRASDPKQVALSPEAIAQVSGGIKPGMVTTMALGEEGGCVPPEMTAIFKEDGGALPRPPITTLALGEEGGLV